MAKAASPPKIETALSPWPSRVLVSVGSRLALCFGHVKPGFSEFTYGFAVSFELASTFPCHVPPLFPSLVQEGRPGGGYDVELRLPGVLLYLQFKLSEEMVNRKAREYVASKVLRLPYFRFDLRDPSRSLQHSSLLTHELGGADVFYVAPEFSRESDLLKGWSTKSVLRSSRFVAPSSIGRLAPGPHTFAWDGWVSVVCSEPRVVQSMNGAAFMEHLSNRLSRAPAPLDRAVSNDLERLVEGVLGSTDESLEPDSPLLLGALESLQSPEAYGRRLQYLAVLSARYLGAQVVALWPANQERQRHIRR